jgi:isopentenyl-diphosphate delta-isomerase
MALPFLKPAMESDSILFSAIDTIHQELKVTMFLTGSARVGDLRKAPLHVIGRTRQMIEKDNPARIKR